MKAILTKQRLSSIVATALSERILTATEARQAMSAQTGAEERKELSGGSVNQGTLMYSQENELGFLIVFLGVFIHNCT